MDEASIRKLLETVASGDTPVDEALQALRALPYEELGFAMLDNHRALRWGFPEVVYCPGKTSEQVAQIMARLATHSSQVLGTRASREQFEAARALVPDLRYDAVARGIWLDKQPDRARKEGVVIAAAGTSDLPVAEDQQQGHALALGGSPAANKREPAGASVKVSRCSASSKADRLTRRHPGTDCSRLST